MLKIDSVKNFQISTTQEKGVYFFDFVDINDELTRLCVILDTRFLDILSENTIGKDYNILIKKKYGLDISDAFKRISRLEELHQDGWV